MRLLRLEAKNFAQHADLDLDLSGFSEAVIIGDNGAGKSKLMDVALYSLFGRPAHGSVDALIREDRGQMWARTTWASDGQEIVITRSRSTETKAGESSLSLSIDGVRATKHTMADTQDAIVRLIGLNREQLLAGPWMAQKESDLLMRMRPAERMTLIASIFDLGRFDPWHERAKEWLAQAERELAVLDDRRQRLEAAIADEPSWRSQHQNLLTDLDAVTERIGKLAQSMSDLNVVAQQLREESLRADALAREVAAANKLADAMATTVEQLNLRLRKASTDARVEVGLEPAPWTGDALAAAQAEYAQYEQASRAKAAYLAELPLRRRAVEEAEAHLSRQHVLCDICPYRDEVPDLAGLRDAVVNLDGKIKGADAVMASFADARAKLDDAQSDKVAATYQHDLWARAAAIVTQAREAVPALEAELRKALDTQAEANVTATTANAERLRLVQSADKAREVAETLVTMTAERKNALDERDRLQRRLGGIEDVIAGIERDKRNIAKLDAEMVGLRVRAEGLRVVARMFHRSGLPTMILETGLPLLESYANEVLSRMPGDLAVAFRTQRLTRSGTWSDEFSLDVIEDSRIREYDAMSGAEKVRVDLALRMAQTNLLAHRSGHRWQTFWIDEGFSDQSRQAIDGVLEAIATFVHDFELSLAVTHQPEVAARFSNQIEVVQSDPDAPAQVRVTT